MQTWHFCLKSELHDWFFDWLSKWLLINFPWVEYWINQFIFSALICWNEQISRKTIYTLAKRSTSLQLTANVHWPFSFYNVQQAAGYQQCSSLWRGKNTFFINWLSILLWFCNGLHVEQPPDKSLCVWRPLQCLSAGHTVVGSHVDHIWGAKRIYIPHLYRSKSPISVLIVLYSLDYSAAGFQFVPAADRSWIYRKVKLILSPRVSAYTRLKWMTDDFMQLWPDKSLHRQCGRSYSKSVICSTSRERETEMCY